MKKHLLNTLLLSFCLTTIGFLMDSDPKEPSVMVRFMEYFGVTAFIFLFLGGCYMLYRLIFLRNKKGLVQ